MTFTLLHGANRKPTAVCVLNGACIYFLPPNTPEYPRKDQHRHPGWSEHANGNDAEQEHITSPAGAELKTFHTRYSDKQATNPHAYAYRKIETRKFIHVQFPIAPNEVVEMNNHQGLTNHSQIF
ncbi:MAG TPA: hypothetical protein PLU16_08305 [Gallionellaceae bacterium]|jgi:hypothetical protein|nr:hypothetical protein [Gallionellaceae bacterium]HQS75197.1 hypothetical protein [Gallionellaceae bacterium]